MDAMRAGVRDVREEAKRQLALDIEIPLLVISVLLNGLAGCREVVLRQNILRHVRLRIAAGYGN
jgi:hypothetical protein